ncbi:MAG: methyl-accepting chemotaxis protein [Solirubrobacterales bacterium]|nr:methyl-accepting chemotaxis protein [Solirubrobacterales bacterium]
MPRLRSFRLGARLGVAFLLLVAALATTVVVGVSALRSTDATDSSSAQGRNLSALRFVSAVATAVESGAHSTVQHLYVYDGDLQTQDEIAARIKTQTGGLQAQAKSLEKSLTSDAARAAYRRVSAAATPSIAAQQKALALSRKETIAQAEERDGSRTTYLEQYLPAQKKLAAATEQLRKAVAADLAASTAGIGDKARSGQRVLLLVGAVALLLALALAVVITRSVTVPTRRLVASLRTVQEQDLTALDAGLQAMARGDLTHRVEPVTEPIGDSARDEVGEAARVVDEVIEQSHASLEAYEQMRTELGDLLGGVRRSATGVTQASAQMAATSQESGRAIGEIASAMTDLARGSERQIAAVDEVRRGAEEVGGRIGQSAEAAAATAEAAATARKLADEGAQTAERATDAMREVGESTTAVTAAIRELAGRSEEIAGIVDTIGGIAEQTNLLALNAAIEAARAGEQGRGFAVVADEVRKLAEEAQGSARQIADVLAEVQRGTRDAVSLVDESAQRTQQGSGVVAQAREAFERIGGAVSDMTDRVAEIAHAAQEIAGEAARMHDEVAGMASIAEESSASTEQVSASTEQTSASTQEVAASAQELAATAAELERLVARFTLETAA